MHTQSLDGDGWTVQAVPGVGGDLSGVPEHIRGRVFPARVPGCVHLDLIRAGVLRHPNLGYAEREQAWVGRTDWRYEWRFVVGPGFTPPKGVSFECLDTVAEIQLNGQKLGSASSFHLPHSLFLPAAIEGENVLSITLRAPVPFVERAHADGAGLPHNGDFLGWAPFNMLRKPAYNFGWDWGPRVATSGIAGPVDLLFGEVEDEPHTTPTVTREADDRWSVSVWIERPADLSGSQDVELLLKRDGAAVVGLAPARSEPVDGVPGLERHWLVVEHPDLWWPRGHGEAAQYELQWTTRRGGQASRLSAPVWFRTVELDTSHDSIGSAFTIRVNGERVFCRGANWIPDGLFPTEASPARVRERVRQAADANMNMLRVWGGGLYEQEAFYDACDEMGIMVWQDFMYACALYPEESRTARQALATEPAYQMSRLRRHPCIVLWCGGNECVEGYQHWGWKDKTRQGADWGLGIWCRDLPWTAGICDPGTPYWPNSPWSSGPIETGSDHTRVDPDLIVDVRDPDHGDRHTWDLHFEDVRQIVPRFVSEFGRIAPACERTLWEAGVFEGGEGLESWPRRAVAMAPEVKEALEHRLRQTGGSKVAYDPVLPEHFRRVATDLRGWLWQTQVLQCRALAVHTEWLRANSPRCMGALIWQLNDCWACQSWSLIDSAGRPKPAWYAVRRSFEPRMLTIQPLGHGAECGADQGRGLASRAAALSAVLVNDTEDAIEATCRVRRETFDGLVLAEGEAPLASAARANAILPNLALLVGEPDDPSTELLIAECDGRRALWFWDRDLRLHLPEHPLAAECAERNGAVTLRLHARALAKDIIIAADLLGEHARAEDNCFTLLAGETREIRIEGVSTCAGLGVEELVRCASGPATSDFTPRRGAGL